MRNEFCNSFGADGGTGFLGCGDSVWKLHRKLFQQTLRPDSSTRYRELHMKTATALVQNLLQDGAASNLEAISMT